MEFFELIKKCRSCRRFIEDELVDENELANMIECARLSPSSGNLQALKFFISFDPISNSKIFRHLKWANYLKDWEGPEKGERPAAYIVILGDNRIHKTIDKDVGIAAQSIILYAGSIGYGTCMIGSIDRQALKNDLGIPGYFDISLVIAIGKPAEEISLEDINASESIEYWRDAEGVHHVPKRRLSELLIKKF